MTRHWTEEEKTEFSQLWNIGWSVLGLQKRYKVGQQTVDSLRKQLGLKSRASQCWTPDRIETAKALWIAGKSAAQIAAELKGGVSRNAVIGKLHRLGLSQAGRAESAKPAPDMRKRKFASPRSAKPKPTGEFVVTGWGRQRSSPEMQANRAAEGQAINAVVAKGGKVESPNARPWMENRRPNECNWTIGDRYQIKFCCNPVHARGWCAGHYALGTVPTPPVRPRAAASLSRFDGVERTRTRRPANDQSIWDDARSEAA